MQSIATNLEELLAKYTSLKYNENNTRIICEWSGHEMPPNINSVLSYVNGNKYKQLLSKNIDSNKLKKMSEFLVSSKHPKRTNQWFCKLTLKHVNKQPDHIERHLNGRKFQKAYKHWLYCQENNIKFVPFSKQQTEKRAEEDEEDHIMSGNESEGSEDSMSDLFPDEMLDLVECDHDSDSYEKKTNHEESMEMEDDQEEVEEKPIKNKKRQLDTKLNKKHKIEPQRKKKVSKN
ncbi:unnamed protein product [Brachionus calyciflorus]|uniref:Surfeit locus protein 2 n=1 Tax=Brachionus calyciflorus TaxID=104777 RepID=A0A814NFY8_9BILA|nr:unnamed protein product [Brachionus calyciflorus]